MCLPPGITMSILWWSLGCTIWNSKAKPVTMSQPLLIMHINSFHMFGTSFYVDLFSLYTSKRRSYTSFIDPLCPSTVREEKCFHGDGYHDARDDYHGDGYYGDGYQFTNSRKMKKLLSMYNWFVELFTGTRFTQCAVYRKMCVRLPWTKLHVQVYVLFL